ncbi:hypothetical protein [Desulfobacula sp.]|uniref:DUF6901 family protein n=2 Tax=Desulfobacula sp. TaxID=2593537 RepID=UPI0026103585|nr:hypothetical protein [Desulfobacula sp.]
MEIIPFSYIFILPEGRPVQMDIQLDSQHLNIIGNCPDLLPEWTELEFYQCPNCPLSVATHTHCPLAANLVNIIKHLDILCSYHQIRVKVIMKNRTITQDTTIQKGISSLMGLVIATSGCPRTRFFKSMARFHLPLADEEETISRAASMYLLKQYFLKNEGKPTDFDLKELIKIYDDMHIVNMAIAERLKAASKTDSAVNAIILLDVFTYVLPLSIEGYLQKFKYLFDLDC